MSSRFAVIFLLKKLFPYSAQICRIAAYLRRLYSNQTIYPRLFAQPLGRRFAANEGLSADVRGKKKAWGSPIAHGAMRKRARPAPTKSAQGGRAPLHVVYVMRLFALRMRAGLCFASPLASPSAFRCGNMCLMHLPYCRFRRRGGCDKSDTIVYGKTKKPGSARLARNPGRVGFSCGEKLFFISFCCFAHQNRDCRHLR